MALAHEFAKIRNMEPLQVSISVADARREVFRLTGDRDFLGAYRLLISRGFTVEAAPALWGLLARRCSEMGASGLASDLHQALWEVGIISADSAIMLATEALNRNDSPKAETLIIEAFGQTPDDEQARQILARAVSERSPERAFDLIGLNALKTVDNAILTIDVMRRAERILEAKDLTRKAKLKFPQDGRLDVREARIHESLSDWPAALAAWKSVASMGGAAQFGARLNQARLLLRLEHKDAALDIASDLLDSNAPLDEKLQLAATMGLTGLISSTVHVAFQAWRRDPEAVQDWDQTSRTLMNLGMIGTLIWLQSRMVPIADSVQDVLQIGLSDEHRQRIGAMAFSTATAQQTPQMVLDRIAPRIPATEAGRASTGPVLIVNATLAAGGAERQLVVLCAALIQAGWPAEKIHLGFFSLSADRRHQHFLTELADLGVTIHDLGDIDTDSCDLSPADQARIAMFPAQLRSDVVQVTGLVQRIRPSVLHGWQDRSALACGWVGLTNNVDRIVLSARNMQPQKRGLMQRSAAPLLRAYCHSPKVIMTANADACARDYEAWLGLPESSIQTLRNGIRTELYRPVRKLRTNGRRKPGITIGGVFRLAANKRPLLWLKTIAALQDISAVPINARLVGRGPFRDEIVELAEELNISNLEMVDDLSEPEDIYGAMDALLLMSRIEGLPNVVLEAHATGMPVAACDVGGVREALCQDSPSGGLLLPADPTAQEAARLLSEWLPNAMNGGEQARQDFIKRQFSMSSLADSIKGIYVGQSAAA